MHLVCIFLAILYLCGFPVALPLAICAIVEGGLLILGDILTGSFVSTGFQSFIDAPPMNRETRRALKKANKKKGK